MLEIGMNGVVKNYTFMQRERERLLLLEFERYKNQQKRVEAMEAAILRYREWGARGNNAKFFRKAKTLEKQLKKMDMLARPKAERPGIPLGFGGGRAAREVLRLKDFFLSVGGNPLFCDVNLTLFHGQRVCLFGGNGTGKTTLVRAALGEHTEFGGALFVAAGARVGYIPQEVRFGGETRRVLDAFLAECPCPEGVARGILAKYLFVGENVQKHVSSLSGGEKVLLKLAVLTQRRTNVLILDEPTNHIDIATRELLEEALLAFDGTLLFISHDRYFIRKVADCVWAIDKGRVVCYDGGLDAYRAALG